MTFADHSALRLDRLMQMGQDLYNDGGTSFGRQRFVALLSRALIPDFLLTLTLNILTR
jgi:hypothetical protein